MRSLLRGIIQNCSRLRGMNSDLKLHIAASVRAARKGADLTQEELAEKINRTPESLSNIERGQAVPSIETLILLSEETDLSLPDLFDQFGNSSGRSKVEHRLEQEIIQIIRSFDEEKLRLAKSQLEALENFPTQ